MTFRLAVRLLGPLFPRHHVAKWPDRSVNSGATSLALNNRININYLGYRFANGLSDAFWALIGSRMQNHPPLLPFPV